MVILDTSIIIDHLRTSQKEESYLIKIVRKYPKEKLAISVISIQELYEGKSTKNKEKEEFLRAVISPLKLLPYSYDTAKLAGEIARDLSRPIELADAAIAATVIINEGKLATLDKTGFRNIKKLILTE